MRRSLWFVIPVLLLCLIPLLQEEAWIGDFDVKLTIDADPQILKQPLRCMTVHEIHLDGAIHAPWTDEEQSGVRRIGPNQLLVSVTCMGRRGLFTDTYHYPRFLVLEYTPFSPAGANPVRRSFAIPEGRGDREMLISLP
jgi:hypothetical protein